MSDMTIPKISSFKTPAQFRAHLRSLGQTLDPDETVESAPASPMAQKITVNGPDRTYIETIHVPQQITGYEYQFLACRQVLIDGLLEPREMPHEETLYIMQLMDSLREKWGVRYPMD